MKKRTLFLSFLILLLILSGCQASIENKPLLTEKNDDLSLSLINPMGPMVIPISGITSGEVKSSSPVEVQYWKTIDEAIGHLSKDEAAFVVLPVTVAANLKASGMDLVMLGVHEWKVFYLIASPEAAFTDWASLKGQTVYTPEAKGQTVDTLTRFALKQTGLDPEKDVKFVYAPPQEIVALFKEGKVPFAALPEPFVSLAIAGGKGKVVLDYQDYWTAQTDSEEGIPIAGLFVNRDFYEHHTESAQKMAELLQSSIEWVKQHPQEAIHESSAVFSIPEQILQEALTRMKFEYIPASDCQKAVIDFLTQLQATYPEGIKAIPTDEFFAKP